MSEWVVRYSFSAPSLRHQAVHNIVAPLFPYDRHAIVRNRGIAQGHWRLRKSGVACVWISDRVRAGEPLADVAKDYGVSMDAARAAVAFCRRFARRKS